jgi:hypothetical protein
MKKSTQEEKHKNNNQINEGHKKETNKNRRLGKRNKQTKADKKEVRKKDMRKQKRTGGMIEERNTRIRDSKVARNKKEKHAG